MVPSPTSYELLDPKPEVAVYGDLASLFQAMSLHLATHHGTVFVRADDPKTRRTGFWDDATRTGWHVRLVTLIYGPDGDGRREWEWRKLFVSSDTRAALAAQLTQGEFPKCEFPRVRFPVDKASQET